MKRLRNLATGTAVALMSTVLAACGGSDDNASTGGAADVSAARAAIAAYVGKPGEFPVVEPLQTRPTGATIAFVQCGTPICALLWQVAEPAAKPIGATLYQVKAGNSAESVNQAFATVVQRKPDAVIAAGIDSSLFKPALEELRAAKIPVVTIGMVNGGQYGIELEMFGEKASALAGRLLADWVVARRANEADVAFYGTPELPFSNVMQAAFETELKKTCSGCKARFVRVPVATIGSTAQNLVVNDLQSHPSTNTAVFATAEAMTGLPAALKTAGISVETVGFGPSPANLQDIKSGGVTAALAFDIPVAVWTLVDASARLIAGQKLAAKEAQGIPPMQFLEKKDIVFDVSRGWTGYPDFPARFSKLWGTTAQP